MAGEKIDPRTLPEYAECNPALVALLRSCRNVIALSDLVSPKFEEFRAANPVINRARLCDWRSWVSRTIANVWQDVSMDGRIGCYIVAESIATGYEVIFVLEQRAPEVAADVLQKAREQLDALQA